MVAQGNPSQNTDRMVGRNIGHYKITSRIGQGGMGVVYQATHDKIKQRVAVKVLHTELSQDEKVVQRFFNEADAISRAQHSSIVKIMDYGQLDDGTAYIMMEFLEGEPLLTRIERAQQQGESLGLHMTVELARQTAVALEVIHQKNIVHRDLKPENLFVVPDPVAPLGERIKLLDFGIAKLLDGPIRKTTVGMIMGTPLYMAPEQCEGREDLGAQVDVYAFGAMLFEMLTGRLPFLADTAAAMMRQHMFKAAPRLREFAPTAPAELDELIAEMLKKDPAERPTISVVAQRLSALIPQVTGNNAPLSTGNAPQRVVRKTEAGSGSLFHTGKASSNQSASGIPDPLAKTTPEKGKLHRFIPMLLGTIALLSLVLLWVILAMPPREQKKQKQQKQQHPATTISTTPRTETTETSNPTPMGTTVVHGKSDPQNAQESASARVKENEKAKDSAEPEVGKRGRKKKPPKQGSGEKQGLGQSGNAETKSEAKPEKDKPEADTGKQKKEIKVWRVE
ncbi:MAG TPA: serine/threonine-protein kinase [Pseudomonadota bacterium]|mgnify:CR=1 FL=1|nr:serine/threonine-protein kinase [Pseudomonadota bacterium]